MRILGNPLNFTKRITPLTKQKVYLKATDGIGLGLCFIIENNSEITANEEG